MAAFLLWVFKKDEVGSLKDEKKYEALKTYPKKGYDILNHRWTQMNTDVFSSLSKTLWIDFSFSSSFIFLRYCTLFKKDFRFWVGSAH
jgi:hypothetical protein